MPKWYLYVQGFNCALSLVVPPIALRNSYGVDEIELTVVWGSDRDGLSELRRSPVLRRCLLHNPALSVEDDLELEI